MSDIFREIDEEIRRERAKDLWDRYGVYVIAAAVAVVVIVGAVSWWESSRRGAAEDAARAYLEADALAELGDSEAAATAFAGIAEDAPGAYEELARMRAAALMAEAGDREGAVAAYDSIASNGSDDLLRGLATLKAAILLADTASPDELEVRLAPLSDEGDPWRASALELLAYAALRKDNRDQAVEQYQALAEMENAPPFARERARSMLRSLQNEGPVARQLPAPGTPATDEAAAEEAAE